MAGPPARHFSRFVFDVSRLVGEWVKDMVERRWTGFGFVLDGKSPRPGRARALKAKACAALACGLLGFAAALGAAHGQAETESIAKVRLDSPRATMRTFLEAMTDYKRGLDADDPALKARLQDAIETLDLSEVPALVQEEVGAKTAVFLKEVMDRVIYVNLAKVPDEKAPGPNGGGLRSWTLRNTDIEIWQVPDGPRAGEYLFSPATVRKAASFYEDVKDRPLLPNTSGAGYEEPWVNRHLPPWMFFEFAGMRLWQWLGLLAAIFLGLVMRAVVRAITKVVLPWTHKTPTKLDTIIVERMSGPAGLILASLVWHAALAWLTPTGYAFVILKAIVRIIASGALIWLFYRGVEIVDWLLKDWVRQSQYGLDLQLVKLFSQSLRVFVLIFGILLAVQNLGVNVFSLLAGLGIVGAAFAFAAQDTLKNFFGSILIMIDRPFRVGDWVVINDAEGTVEDVGFRSTRIRTFYNSLITIPNGEVAVKAVDNMGLRVYRRYKTMLSVTYDTPPEKIEAFCEGLKNIVKASPDTRKDYFHIVANEFNSSSIDVMVYIFFKVPDWGAELVARHNFILEAIRLAQALGVEFAFPTQTLHVESLAALGERKEAKPWEREDLATVAREFGPGGNQGRPQGSGLYTPPQSDHDLRG